MQHIPAKELLKKYKLGLCTEEEQALIESWYLQLPEGEADLSPFELEDSLNRIEDGLPIIQHRRKLRSIWYKTAGSVTIAILISVVAYIHFHKPINHNSDTFALKTVKPGNKAILTLAGGRQIVLNNNASGQLATQGKVVISKTSGGQIYYNAAAAPAGSTPQINNITTPRGYQYQITLADGTKVWLNAASSITYPVAFTGNSREVSITGEAYFEVTKNKEKPFLVKSGVQTVRVLGTHFNINTYLDNGPFMETTLLEGSVEVSDNSTQARIKPGQQARVSTNPNNGKIAVVSADTEEILPWRSGDLLFENQDIRNIMDKVSRLYDMDVEYQDNLPIEKFNGEISHTQSVAEVLKMLQQTCNVHFKTEGRRVIVTL